MARHWLSDQAKADLRGIKAWTRHKWGDAQSGTYLRELRACLERLAAVPMMGTACDQIRAGYRRFPAGEHWVYYRIEDVGVVIAHIGPQRMLPRKEILDDGRPR